MVATTKYTIIYNMKENNITTRNYIPAIQLGQLKLINCQINCRSSVLTKPNFPGFFYPRCTKNIPFGVPMHGNKPLTKWPSCPLSPLEPPLLHVCVCSTSRGSVCTLISAPSMNARRTAIDGSMRDAVFRVHLLIHGNNLSTYYENVVLWDKEF